MKVLIIGSGAREHALAKSLSGSPSVSDVTVSPGNAGIALSFKTISLVGIDAVRDYCLSYGIDLVVLGGETEIAAAWADNLQSYGINVFGPTGAAGMLESSKSFAKNLMLESGVPTAAYAIANSFDEATALLQSFQYPLVIKADGLAAGKGVYIIHSTEEAIETCAALMKNNSLGSAGAQIVIEEFMQGWEVSLFAITDGENFKTMLFAQDHKQLLDNDMGPNTGGMGAYAPVVQAEPYRAQIEEEIIRPVLKAMKARGCKYRGLLYCGLMITKSGPKVVEFNCRFGDPETQALLPLLESDLFELMLSAAQGKLITEPLKWSSDTSVCVVLASEGYPGKYRSGSEISIPQELESDLCFAGVKSCDGTLQSSGGRVLSLVATGKDILQARDKVYADIPKVRFDGCVFRNDIGLRKNTL